MLQSKLLGILVHFDNQLNNGTITVKEKKQVCRSCCRQGPHKTLETLKFDFSVRVLSIFLECSRIFSKRRLKCSYLSWKCSRNVLTVVRQPQMFSNLMCCLLYELCLPYMSTIYCVRCMNMLHSLATGCVFDECISVVCNVKQQHHMSLLPFVPSRSLAALVNRVVWW